MSESNLPALQAELARIGTEAAEWANVEASGSTGMVHVGSADPEKMREQMIAVRREAREKSKELRTAADAVKAEIQAELRRQQGEMEAQMRAAMAALEPLQQQVKRMEEGIWTVNLYLGTSEEVVTLRKGKPAPIDTPIHMRTSVLAMDEEVAAFPVEVGKTDWQGMDYRDVEEFDRWLVEEPAHLAQVLPEERGIVVFTPRRTSKVYHEDPIVNAAMNEDNFESYWLIRNGENLYRLRTNFPVGRNLMPITSEFTKLFQREVRNHDTGQWEMVEIQPGTREWEDAEKAQDDRRRHFMRVALIVQGLIDRTELFAPLHAAVNVMQQATYDDGLVVVINDTEMALTSSREPYFDWIKRLNADLRPGMRIIGTFRGIDWNQDDYGDRYDSRNSRLSPPSAERPPTNVLLTIDARREFRGQKGLVVKYARTGEVYDPKMWVPSETRPGYGHYGGYRTPSRRASAVILPTDKFVIPFDLVTVEEMQTYLDARTERHAYADMFPLLQAAIVAKHEEAAAEAPFRDLLTRVLADDNDQQAEDVQPHIDGLVHRFKLGNKWHRPLVSLSQEDEAKAIRLIRAEYQRIVNSGADETRDAHAVKVLREHDPEVMFVGRLSSGKYVAFAPIERAYRDGAAHPNLWVREHVTTKTAKSIKTREWITPGVRAGRMTTLFETERWTEWDRISESDLTDAEMDAMLNRFRTLATNRLGADGILLAIEHDYVKRCWTAYGVDHALDGQRRENERRGAEYTRIRSWWERDGEPRFRDQPLVRGGEFDMSYGGNSLLGSGIAASDRDVYMPWTKRRSEATFPKAGQSTVTKPDTVVYEADDATIAAVVKHVRSVENERDEAYERDQRVRSALYGIERQQVAQEVERIKAEFLTSYPDEDMWEEKREGLVKGVKAAIEVTESRHFMERYNRTVHESGATSYSLRDREGYRSLGDTLRALDSASRGSWDGLTVRDVYRLAEEPWPDVYEPIAGLIVGQGAED